VTIQLLRKNKQVHGRCNLSGPMRPGNDTFKNLKLAHVNTEAVSIGRLVETTPRLDAAKQDFISTSPQADIYHFSMHAQLEGENPLSSFLAFKSDKSDSGRLTVSDLLSIRLKPNSLFFWKGLMKRDRKIS